MNKVKITGIGSYIPSRRITNQQWEQLVETSDEWIMKNIGIKTRSRVEPGQTTTDMGVNSSRLALKGADVSADDLDLIICATNSQDYLYPSTASQIQERLGAPSATSFDVQAGCTGWLYSMRLATSMIVAGQAKKVLVVGSDALSLALSFYDRSSTMFGDGSGAALLEAGENGDVPRLGRPRFATRTAPSMAMKQGTICTEDQNRLEDYLDKKDMSMVKRPIPNMEGKGSLRLALTETKASVDTLFAELKESGVEAKSFDMFVPHQTNNKVIKALCEHVDFDFEKIPYTLEKYGGISTAGIPTGLYEHWRAGKIKKGDLVLTCGYGAGFTAGAMALEWGVENA